MPSLPGVLSRRQQSNALLYSWSLPAVSDHAGVSPWLSPAGRQRSVLPEGHPTCHHRIASVQILISCCYGYDATHLSVVTRCCLMLRCATEPASGCDDCSGAVWNPYLELLPEGSASLSGGRWLPRSSASVVFLLSSLLGHKKTPILNKERPYALAQNTANCSLTVVINLKRTLAFEASFVESHRRVATTRRPTIRAINGLIIIKT